MTITEKVAYVKGLVAGLELDGSKKETKVILAMLDVLDEMAASVTDCEDDIISLGEEVDTLSESVSDLEDTVYLEDDEDDDDEDDEDGDGAGDDGDEDEGAIETDDGEPYEADVEDTDFFEFTCPKCGEKMYLDEEILERGSIKCKACGHEVSFEIVDEDGCEGCPGCGEGPCPAAEADGEKE